MKAVKYISLLAILVLGSCSSGLYTGFEYDDLYYLPSDKQVAVVQPSVSRQMTEGDLKAQEYYDNIYAADTLVSDEYSEAVENLNALPEASQGTINNYYFDNNSYTGRLRRFYGNYFYPYWRDPFYSSWGWPSMSFGYGYPYNYDPFMYDPYYDFGYYGYYGGYYSPWSYGSYYSPFYSSYYWPYYNNWGYYSNSYYGRDYNNSIAYGRRDRQSVYSTKWNDRMMPASASSRRDSYISRGSNTDGVRRSPVGTSTSVTSDPRKSVSTNTTNRPALNGVDRNVDPGMTKSAAATGNRSVTTRTTTVSKPEYNTVNRTYTPSYSNPRMSTRPSYNNSRVNTESSGTGSYRTTPARTSPSVSAGEYRSAPSYNSSGSYSAPSRRSSGGSVSSGSYSSSPSRSYNSGSSGGSSRSYSGSSSGSSSSSSSSSSSGSSHSSSSGGRR